jgi:hypothetical protein
MKSVSRCAKQCKQRERTAGANDNGLLSVPEEMQVCLTDSKYMTRLSRGQTRFMRCGSDGDMMCGKRTTWGKQRQCQFGD